MLVKGAQGVNNGGYLEILSRAPSTEALEQIYISYHFWDPMKR